MEITNEQKTDLLRQIKELDVDAGLKATSRMVPVYLKVLGLFVKNQPEDSVKLNGYIESSDYEAFGVLVHGYKSILGNLGAQGLSEMASELDAASRKQDESFIKEQFPAFDLRIRSLADKVAEII